MKISLSNSVEGLEEKRQMTVIVITGSENLIVSKCVTYQDR